MTTKASAFAAQLYFPDSEYLAGKWWHRLAIVIFWSWLLLATGVLIALGVEIYEFHRDWNKTQQQLIFLLVMYPASLFLPSVVYRAILFVCTGSAWKGTKSA